MLHNKLAELLAAAAMLPIAVCAGDIDYHFDGHTKGRFIGQAFPNNSVFNDLSGSEALDFESDLRLNFEADKGPWSLHASYQLFLLFGDRIEYSRQLPAASGLVFDRLPNDERRLFDLTHVVHDEDKFAALHRLDRSWFGFSGDKTVVRVGRQALSWGNGFFFAPLDIVNPFDPTAIDTEYKTGDDMLYAQYLRDNGHDIQFAVVGRRNIQSGDVESDEGTYSVKYHGLAGEGEYDVLLAGSYGDLTLGVGGNVSIGGAVWRGDLLVTDSESSTEVQFVTNLNYSWVWGGRNFSGVVEYYFNGFGQPGGDYGPADLAGNPELTKRLARGELFTLGRNYLAGGATIEMTPLWTLTPNLFLNLDDGSAFLQIVSQNSLSDNMTFLGALNIPLGPDGSEYGGIETAVPGRYFSVDLNVFAQLAWYF